jgi:hypothetical protein
MPKPIENLGKQILYEIPGAVSLLMAGGAVCIGFADASVRKGQDAKEQANHLQKLHKWAMNYFPVLVATGAITAFAAYNESKEKMWLVGGATLLSVVPYHFLIRQTSIDKLGTILKESEGAELTEIEKQPAIEAVKKWDCLIRGKFLFALGSAAVFFVARQYTKGA